MKDVSATNASLHRLYVGLAQEHLTVIGEAIELLSAMSQYQPSETVALLSEQRRRLVIEDAAYRDAAANLLAGIPAPEASLPVEEPAKEPETRRRVKATRKRAK